MMRIVIQGAGALGSILAAHLARSGVDVVLLARGARAVQVPEQGVIITGLIEAQVPVPVATDPATLEGADLLVTTVKTYQTDTALAQVRHLNVGSVLSVQNGVLKNEQLAAVFGPEQVLGAVAAISGEVLSDGRVLFTANRGLYVGEPAGRLSSRVEAIVRAFDAAGIVAIASEDIAIAEWSKFVSWGAVMALSVLTRLETWKFLSDAGSAQVAASMVREAVAVAAARGVAVDDSGPLPSATIATADEKAACEAVQAAGRHFAEAAPRHRMSTLQDLDHGRHLEVEETLAFLLKLAREHGIAAPVTTEICGLVQAIDHFQD
jgi:2-dehydropantoate 2-reductase